jgi:ABC-2 type transport system ATP-binding protein
MGLLGLNGSGKTTLFDCIAGLEDYSGEPMNLERGDFSYMCLRRNLFSDMNVRNAVSFYADFYKDFDKENALRELTELKLSLKQNIRRLSAGQYRIVTFILAINCKAKIYMFDEPLSNLDIIYRDFVIKKLISTINEDRIYIVSSHELSELENIYSHIAIIKDKGVTPLLTVDEVKAKGISVSDFYKEEVICSR